MKPYKGYRIYTKEWLISGETQYDAVIRRIAAPNTPMQTSKTYPTRQEARDAARAMIDILEPTSK